MYAYYVAIICFSCNDLFILLTIYKVITNYYHHYFNTADEEKEVWRRHVSFPGSEMIKPRAMVLYQALDL